jgi:hypothetical protein
MTWRAPRALTRCSCGACRRDDLDAARRAEGDQQAAGDSAGSVDQKLLTGVDVQPVAENCSAVSAGTGKAAAPSQLALGSLQASSPAGAIS